MSDDDNKFPKFGLCERLLQVLQEGRNMFLDSTIANELGIRWPGLVQLFQKQAKSKLGTSLSQAGQCRGMIPLLYYTKQSFASKVK